MACHDVAALADADRPAHALLRSLAAYAASGQIVAVGTAGSNASSSRPSSKPNTPSKQRKPDTLLVSK